MTALILDTSSNDALLALSQMGAVEECLVSPHEQHLSASLVPDIEKLLKKLEKSPKDLSYVAVGIGPGSYTGTRVGVAVAKSLSLALKIPLIPFCSLLAFVLPTIEGAFACLMESKQGDTFVLKGSAAYGHYETISQTLVPPAGLAHHLSGTQHTFSSLPLSPLSIPRLASHLFRLYQSQAYFSFDNLSNLELLYLHQIPLPQDLKPVCASTC